MSSVFISYAGADVEFASQLASALQHRIDCWFDKYRIQPGAIWLDEIQNGLRNADWAILIVSPAFFEHEFTCAELREITTRNIYGTIKVFPILLNILPHEFRQRAGLLHHTSCATQEMDIASIVDAFLGCVREVRTTLPPAERRCHRKDGLIYIHIPAGSFMMGASRHDSLAEKNEVPAHAVTLRGFWMSASTITEAAFYRFQLTQSGLALAAPRPGDSDLPRINVSWAEASQYANWAGGNLPTEAQWEYSARGGGTERLYPWGTRFPAMMQIIATTGARGSVRMPRATNPIHWGYTTCLGTLRSGRETAMALIRSPAKKTLGGLEALEKRLFAEDLTSLHQPICGSRAAESFRPISKDLI